MSLRSSLRGDCAPRLTRRELLKLSAAGVVGFSSSGWLERLAADTATHPQRRRSCILLWMTGGPSQMDTFDLKPGHRNGGPYREIATATPGIRISEHLPQLARQMNDIVLIRSMSTREADHGRGTYLMHTGYVPMGAIQYPTLGSLVAKELGTDDAPLPNFVSIAPFRAFNPAAYGSGFLGPQYAPLLVGDRGNNQFVVQQPGQNPNIQDALRVQDLQPPREITRPQNDARIDLLEQMERDFVARHPGISPLSHRTAYNRAVRLMRTAAATAFNLDEEPASLRDRYGRSLFGQGCLLARRLVERGVPFIEVNLGNLFGNGPNWDTHAQNFDTVRRLSGELDPAWATLMEDLRERGLLDTTLIVWMGEFGRTPNITGNQGRDHFATAWSTVLAGGGIRGGQVVGRTSADGSVVEADRPTSVPDFIATICLALGIDPMRQNRSNVIRPIRIADPNARPHREIIRTA
jgi:hypothetical protein